MIKVFGRLLCVPENEKMLGFVDDNLVETRKFKITDPALYSFSFKLELENGSFINIMDLPGEMEDGALILSWHIPSSCLRFAGPLYAQLRAFNDDNMVWHSEIAEFSVYRSLQAENELPAVVPTEFAEMEKRMTNILSSAEAVLLSTENNAAGAKDAAHTAESAAEEAASYSETFFAASSACEENVAKAAEILSRVQGHEESIAVIRESALKILEDTLSASSEAKAYSEESSAFMEKAKMYAEKIESSLGDFHTALDAILALETAYMGGDAS